MIEFGSYRLGSVADAKRPFVHPPVYAACVLISMLVGGCAVGMKYKAPSVTVSPFHGTFSVDAGKAGLAAPTLDRWWEGFGIVEATVQRSRPVVLTALAAVLAFVPLTFSAFWRSLAYELIGNSAYAGVPARTLFDLVPGERFSREGTEPWRLLRNEIE